MKVDENPKMPYPPCGRSIKTSARGNNEAPSITKYGSPVRLDAQIVALRPHCTRTALRAPPLAPLHLPVIIPRRLLLTEDRDTPAESRSTQFALASSSTRGTEHKDQLRSDQLRPGMHITPRRASEALPLAPWCETVGVGVQHVHDQSGEQRYLWPRKQSHRQPLSTGFIFVFILVAFCVTKSTARMQQKNCTTVPDAPPAKWHLLGNKCFGTSSCNADFLAFSGRKASRSPLRVLVLNHQPSSLTQKHYSRNARSQLVQHAQRTVE